MAIPTIGLGSFSAWNSAPSPATPTQSPALSMDPSAWLTSANAAMAPSSAQSTAQPNAAAQQMNALVQQGAANHARAFGVNSSLAAAFPNIAQAYNQAQSDYYSPNSASALAQSYSPPSNPQSSLVPGGMTYAQAARQPTTSAPQYAPANSGAPGSMASSGMPAQDSPEWLALGDMLRHRAGARQSIRNGTLEPDTSPAAMYNGVNLSALSRTDAVSRGVLDAWQNYWNGDAWKEAYNYDPSTNSLSDIGYQA